MVVPAGTYLQTPEWAFICTSTTAPRLEFSVQKVAYTDDAQTYAGVDSVTVSGFFLESILNNIVFLAESPETERGLNASEAAQAGREEDCVADGLHRHDRRLVRGHRRRQDEGCKDRQGLFVREHGAGQVQAAHLDSQSRKRRLRVFAVRLPRKRRDRQGRLRRDGHKYLPEFEYGGNVFYYDEHKKLCQAQGVADSRADSYFVKKQQWDILDKEDIYGKYYEQTVKGPWQRTEALEPVTEGDSVDDIGFRWARRMMGDWIFYAEPE